MANYRIIVCGVEAGRSVDEVAEALSRMSIKPPSYLRQMLDGRRVVFKRTVQMQKAVKYRRALESIGCVCMIEADESESADTGAPAVTVNLTDSIDRNDMQSAVREFEYAKKPGLSLRGIVRHFGPGEWILVAAVLLFALYQVIR